MRLLDQICLRNAAGECSIQLLAGDLTALPSEHAVDLLLVSAFPNDYSPTSGSLIGALDRIGVSVADLARTKAVDLRQFSSCWLSQPLADASLPFRRILCFEPALRGRAPELVGDLFRSIVPLITDDPPIRSIAMPRLASGDQGEPGDLMLSSLVSAALHWLQTGLNLQCIKIVLRESSATDESLHLFAQIREKYLESVPNISHGFDYDLFVSYAHKDVAPADAIINCIRQLQPQLRLFVDRFELNPGSSWQMQIYDALDRSKQVLCLLSPQYLASKVCLEEFNIAMLRNRDVPHSLLLPIYLRSAPLPSYMRLIQYLDAREAEPDRLHQCVQQLKDQLLL